MTTPNRNELIFYTNKPLDDKDWETNFLQLIEWLTGGNYDLTVNNFTVSGDQTVSGDLTVTGDITTSGVFKGDGSQLTGLNINNKNWIINGGANVDQKALDYTLVKDTYGKRGDMWFGMATGTAVNAGVLTLSSSPNCGNTGRSFKFSGVTITGTGIIYFRYRMESLDALNFVGKIASFSCKTYHDIGTATNYTIFIRKADSTDDFSSVTEISNSGTISIPDITETSLSLENISLGSCGNGIEIEVKIECGTITTKNIEFSELQFELGAVATSYESKSVAIDTQNSARYYQKWGGSLANEYILGFVAAASVLRVIYFFPTEFRTTPSITITGALSGDDGTTNATFNFSSSSGTTKKQAYLQGTCTGLVVGRGANLQTDNINSFIEFSAEL